MADTDYDQVLAIYRALAQAADLQVKGKANPYTSMNGNMFSFLDKSGVLCLRLSKIDQAAFVSRYQTEPVIQHGAVMKDYVAVPRTLLDDHDELSDYLQKCIAYAASLPAKKTTRK